MDDEKLCPVCHGPVVGRRADAVYCSTRCTAEAASYRTSNRCIECGGSMTRYAEARCVKCRQVPNVVWSRETVIEAISAFVLKNGRVPKRVELGGGTMPTPRAMIRVFGSVADAVRAAGFDPRPHGGYYGPNRGHTETGRNRNRQTVTGRGNSGPGAVVGDGTHRQRYVA